MVGRFSRSLLKLFIWLFMAGAVIAQDLPPIEGSQTAEFKDALSRWLDGDDLEALRAFSALAQSGNVAAQIMLGRISEDGSLYGHVTATMPRKERVALLKQPGGLSGKSWLLAAEPRDPLAAAFVGASRVDDRAKAVSSLFKLGEPTAAMKTGLDLIYQGEARALLVALAGAEPLPKEAKFLEFSGLRLRNAGPYRGSARIGGMGLEADPRLSAEVQLAWLTPTATALLDDPDLLKLASEKGPSVQSWTPLVSFCDAHCPTSKGTCVALGAALASGLPFPFESPSERLLPDEVYWASPRMEGDMVRKYENLSGEGWQNTLKGVDACFMPAITRLQESMAP